MSHLTFASTGSITDASEKRLQNYLRYLLRGKRMFPMVPPENRRQAADKNGIWMFIHPCYTRKQFHTFLEHNFYWERHNYGCIKTSSSTLQTGKTMVLKLEEAFTVSLELNQQLPSDNTWRGTSYMVWGGFKPLESQTVLMQWWDMSLFYVCSLLI